MTDTNTAEREALMDLIDAYAEARHVGGCHTYNAKTAEARAKVVASLAASAGGEPVAPSEDVQKKIQSNTWDHFGAILPTLKAISRGDWYWGANSRCKYIEIRLDTRDGGCLLFDRERVRISPEQFAHQSHGGVKMEPWPVANLTHHSPPEGMAGWRPIETAPEKGVFLVYMPTADRDGDRIQVAVWHPNVKVVGHLFAFDCAPITHWMPLPAPPLPASEAKEAGQ
ncbi:MAG: hypothetical protein WAP57_11785 [Aquabacterium commune]|uniref:hypothetical protein n=1 Tax=Aquabacterium commune TaxID=70586 RepID=UPI003BB17620